MADLDIEGISIRGRHVSIRTEAPRAPANRPRVTVGPVFIRLSRHFGILGIAGMGLITAAGLLAFPAAEPRRALLTVTASGLLTCGLFTISLAIAGWWLWGHPQRLEMLLMGGSGEGQVQELQDWLDSRRAPATLSDARQGLGWSEAEVVTVLASLRRRGLVREDFDDTRSEYTYAVEREPLSLDDRISALMRNQG